MQTNFMKFRELLASDADLRGRVAEIHKQAVSAFAQQISHLATEAGMPFTAEEYLAGLQGSVAEFSDDELESVAGGVGLNEIWVSVDRKADPSTCLM